jgi:DNA-binding NarL/FixJ family response regulator
MKIVIADDHRLVRDGLRALLEREGMEVVGEAASGREVIPLFFGVRPDVLIMDVAMPELNGIDATRQVLAASPLAKVIGLSMNDDRRHVIAMLNAGASAYLLKTSAADELLQAIREVVADRKYVSPAIAGVVLDELAASSAAPALTTREREVLQLVAEGLSSKEIACRLNVAVPTVETHRRQIMDKLGLRTIAQLTKYAIREGLTSSE